MEILFAKKNKTIVPSKRTEVKMYSHIRHLSKLVYVD